MTGFDPARAVAEFLNSAQRLTLPAAANLWASLLDIDTMHEFHIVLWKIYAAHLID